MDPISKSIARHARNQEPRHGLQLEDVLVRLCRGQVVLTRSYSAGPYTPAVADPSGYSWCVMDRGGPVVLAYDAFETARWLLLCERGVVDAAGSVRPIRLPSDEEQAATRRETDESLQRWRDRCDAWLAYQRLMAMPQRPRPRRVA